MNDKSEASRIRALKSRLRKQLRSLRGPERNRVKEQLESLELKHPTKPTGRPKSDPDQRQRSPALSFRMWLPVYEELKKTAAATGRTMAAEAEHRLEESLAEETDFKTLLVYGESALEAFKLLRLMMGAISLIEVEAQRVLEVEAKKNTDARKPGLPDVKLKRWDEDPQRAQQVFETLLALSYAVLVTGIKPLEGRDDYARELREIAGVVGEMDDAAPLGNKAEFFARMALLGAGYKTRGLTVNKDAVINHENYQHLAVELDKIIGTMDKHPDYPMEFLSRTGRKIVERLRQDSAADEGDVKDDTFSRGGRRERGAL
jgi:hypothetical protein